jgi:hypothetical protein
MNFSVTPGVKNLLERANEKSSYVGEKFFFLGDLNQLSIVEDACRDLNITFERDYGLPFVTSKEDKQKVIQYLIDHQIEGWWNYVSQKEYCRIKGQFFFIGTCSMHYDEVKEIAEKLGIDLLIDERSRILYTPSEESYNTIISKLEQDYGVVIED